MDVSTKRLLFHGPKGSVAPRRPRPVKGGEWLRRRAHADIRGDRRTPSKQRKRWERALCSRSTGEYSCSPSTTGANRPSGSSRGRDRDGRYGSRSGGGSLVERPLSGTWVLELSGPLVVAVVAVPRELECCSDTLALSCSLSAERRSSHLSPSHWPFLGQSGRPLCLAPRQSPASPRGRSTTSVSSALPPALLFVRYSALRSHQGYCAVGSRGGRSTFPGTLRRSCFPSCFALSPGPLSSSRRVRPGA